MCHVYEIVCIMHMWPLPHLRNRSFSVLSKPPAVVIPVASLSSPSRGTCMYAKSLQLCPTVCDPVDCSPPVFFVHGKEFSRHYPLEWVAMPFSWESSQPRDRSHPSLLCLLHWQVGSLPLVSPGKPPYMGNCFPPWGLSLHCDFYY